MSLEHDTTFSSKLVKKSSSLFTLFRKMTFQKDATSLADATDPDESHTDAESPVSTQTPRESSEPVVCSGLAERSSGEDEAQCDEDMQFHCKTTNGLSTLDMAMKILNECEEENVSDSDSDTYYESVTATSGLESEDEKVLSPSTRNVSTKKVESSNQVTEEEEMSGELVTTSPSLASQTSFSTSEDESLGEETVPVPTAKNIANRSNKSWASELPSLTGQENDSANDASWVSTFQTVSQQENGDPNEASSCYTYQTVGERKNGDPNDASSGYTYQTVGERKNGDPNDASSCYTYQTVRERKNGDSNEASSCYTYQTVTERKNGDLNGASSSYTYQTISERENGDPNDASWSYTYRDPNEASSSYTYQTVAGSQYENSKYASWVSTYGTVTNPTITDGEYGSWTWDWLTEEAASRSRQSWKSELDFIVEAWIPSKETTTILEHCRATKTTPRLSRENATRPALSTDEIIEDPVQNLIIKLKGSVKRKNVAWQDVRQNEDGVEDLMMSGNYRVAANLCAKLLTRRGQGFDHAATAVSKITTETLWLWFDRIYCLTRLKMYEMAASELAPFKNLDNPDMYYGFYPREYPGIRGSLVPFEFRRFHAEFPRYVGEPFEALYRQHKVLSTNLQILKNLNNGLTEMGDQPQNTTDVDREECLKLWTTRRTEILAGIGNTLVAMKDYDLAIKVYDEILRCNPKSTSGLQSIIGRLFTYLGNIKAAQRRFEKVEMVARDLSEDRVRVMLNKGLLYFALDKYEQAFAQFESALNLDPRNAVARNNKAICLLLLGRPKETFEVFENDAALKAVISVRQHTEDCNRQQVVAEAMLSNLLTMYEFGPWEPSLKKEKLFLNLVAPYCGDSFDITPFEDV